MTQPTLLQTALSYYKAGLDIIPVHRNDKAPVGKGWPDKPALTPEGINKAVKARSNLGVRLGHNDLIIDVDVKNRAEGQLSMARLQKAIPILKEYPYTTMTPSKGWHYLFTIPEWLDGADMAYQLKAYPGIQFLSTGQQALIGGSSIDSKLYTPNPNLLLPAPELPDALADVLIKGDTNGAQASPAETTRQAVASGWGCLDPEELAQLLTHFPVLDYAANTPNMWFDMMCACHYVTAGEGFDEFAAWSAEDPLYGGHEGLHRPRWRSLTDKVGHRAITGKYLQGQLRRLEVTGTQFTDKMAMAEAGGQFDIVNPDHAAEADQDADYLDMVRTVMTAGDAEKVLLKLVKDRVGPLMEGQVIKALHTRDKNFAMGDLRKGLKKIQEAMSEEGDELTENKACHEFIKHHGGRDRVLYAESQLWIWNAKRGRFEGHGNLPTRGLVKRFLEHRKVKVTNAFCRAITDLLLSDTTLDEKEWNLGKSGQGQMFNMKNGELWITPTGLDLRPHDPKNMRRAVLDMEFDPDNLGLPERWLKYLASAFNPDDLDLISDQLAVGIAYTMTESQLFMKKCWFLYGPSNTGKSQVTQLMHGLVGDKQASAVPLSKLGESRFATAQLVGKLVNTQAEVNRNDKTEPSMFKALVAGDPLDAERKNEAPFLLMNRAVLWLGGNHLPQFATGSSGVLERICVIPYENALRHEDLDGNLLDKFLAEKQDIFHWALTVYADAYREDRCLRLMNKTVHDPEDSELLATEVSPHQGWLTECLDFTDDSEDVVTMTDLYTSYATWQTAADLGPYMPNAVSLGRKMSEWLREIPGHRVDRVRAYVDGKQQRCYRRLKIK